MIVIPQVDTGLKSSLKIYGRHYEMEHRYLHIRTVLFAMSIPLISSRTGYHICNLDVFLEKRMTPKNLSIAPVHAF